MRLIDAEEIIWEINEIHKNHGLKDNEQMIFDETDVIGLIVTAPAIDAVPVVRCKDCKEFVASSGEFGICLRHSELWGKNGFCSCGERKDNETD